MNNAVIAGLIAQAKRSPVRSGKKYKVKKANASNGTTMINATFRRRQDAVVAGEVTRGPLCVVGHISPPRRRPGPKAASPRPLPILNASRAWRIQFAVSLHNTFVTLVLLRHFAQH